MHKPAFSKRLSINMSVDECSIVSKRVKSRLHYCKLILLITNNMPKLFVPNDDMEHISRQVLSF